MSVGFDTMLRDEQSVPLLFNAITNSLQQPWPSATSDQHQYPQRWYMLAVVALLNLSNGMVSLVISL